MFHFLIWTSAWNFILVFKFYDILCIIVLNIADAINRCLLINIANGTQKSKYMVVAQRF